MTLAAILAVYILSFGWLSPSVLLSAASAVQPQNQPAQGPQPNQPPASTAGQTQNPANPAQQPPKPHKRPKKTVPDCGNSSAVANPAGSSSDSKKPEDVGPPNSGSGNSPATSAATQKPCPPRKKVVRNGGTDEPTIKLTGETTAAQASQQRATTDQLNASTEENLKKIADRQLAPSQQEIVTQIQQFVDQSKQAVAAGDLERAHNLALKARLLSDELLKP
ncbi:MAG: hypothetical protein WAN65_15195 [Candidatus Sulfotelmatobacter sp.]